MHAVVRQQYEDAERAYDAAMQACSQNPEPNTFTLNPCSANAGLFPKPGTWNPKSEPLISKPHTLNAKPEA